MQGQPTLNPTELGIELVGLPTPESQSLLQLNSDGSVATPGLSNFSRDALALADAGAWRGALGVESPGAMVVATIADTDWTGSDPYIAAKTISGILSTDVPIVDLDLSEVLFADVPAKQANWAQVYRVVTSTDTVTFYATASPTESLPIQIKVVR